MRSDQLLILNLKLAPLFLFHLHSHAVVRPVWVVKAYDFLAPAFCADVFRPDGRLSKLCKGGDGGAGAAQASMAQAQQQHEDNMKLLRQQQRLAANAPSADAFQPASPPQMANTDTVAASTDLRRRALMRFNFNSTVSNPLGSTTTLGGGA